MEKTFTPEEALSIVDQVCSVYSGSREEHYNIQKAITTLREVVGNSDSSDEKKKLVPVATSYKK